MIKNNFYNQYTGAIIVNTSIVEPVFYHLQDTFVWFRVSKKVQKNITLFNECDFQILSQCFKSVSLSTSYITTLSFLISIIQKVTIVTVYSYHSIFIHMIVHLFNLVWLKIIIFEWWLEAIFVKRSLSELKRHLGFYFLLWKCSCGT